MRSSAGAKIATINQFTRKRTIRIVRNRRGLQGIMGGLAGAPLTRRLPRLGSGGGGAVRGSGARASSAIALNRSHAALRQPCAVTRAAEQLRAHELVEVAVEHALGVAGFDVCAVVLDPRVGVEDVAAD